MLDQEVILHTILFNSQSACVQQTLTHAVLWPSKRSSFTEVMLSHCIASAFPVGTESFLLDSPPARDPPEAPSTPPLNPEGSNTAAADANEAETGGGSVN